MNPPQVRTLDQLVADSNPVFDPQRTALNTQIAGAGNRQVAAEAGLGAAQTTAFGDITQNAVRRGALFSGFTPDQQARYTAEKFLPALANLRAENEQTVQGLQTGIMQLDADQRSKALETREGDLTKLYDYEKVQSDRKFQTEQANIAYQREMEKLKQQQAFEAKQSASNTAANQPSAAQNMAAALTAKAGTDGYVHQGTYGALKQQWVSGGYGNAAQFDQLYAGYRNPKNNQYKLG